MQLFSLIYAMTILCIYIITITMSFLIFATRKTKVLKYVGLLFTVFAIDHIVITLTELVPSFGRSYEQIFLTVPSVKTVVYAFSFYLLVRLLQSEMPDADLRFLMCVQVLTIVSMLFVPMLPNSAMKSMLYFTPAQIFLFLYAANGLLCLRKGYAETKGSWNYPFLGRMFVMMLIFAVVIIIEDYYVIFHIDQYEGAAITIFNRSISEDLFRALLAALSIRTIINYLKRNAYVADSPSQDTFTEKSFPAEELSQQTAQEDTVVKQIVDASADDFSDVTISGAERLPKEGLKAVEEDLSDDSLLLSEDELDPVLISFCKEYQLTARETEILSMVLKSMTNQEISDALFVSLGTTKTHTHNIFFKLGVSRRKELFKMFSDYKAKQAR